MRLIDADALMEQIERLKQEEVSEKTGRDELNILAGIEYTQDIVEHLPTIGWVSVKDRLPEEHKSMWSPWYGTPKWSKAMWRIESDKVIVNVLFQDKTSVVTTAHLHDGEWVTAISKSLQQTVTHWMPLPEPPEEVK